MFSFLQSYFLWGLAAVSLPFLIHLLNRRKPKRIRFSTLFFLKQLQQKKMRRLKIRQLLLLLLRALIVLMFVLAFSRPTMKSQSFLLGQANVRTAAAIVLDNSMSIQLEGGQGVLYNKALEGVKQILQQLKQGDQISLFLSCPIPDYSDPQIFESSETIIQILNKTQPTMQVGDLMETTLQARKQLEESFFPNKELFVFSDFQKSSWQGLLQDNLQVISSDIRTFLYDVGNEKKGNFAVKEVRLKNQIIELGKTISVASSVDNHSPNNSNDLMVHAFLLNKRAGQNTIQIESNRSKEVDFNLLVKQTGFISGLIELEDDLLMADNRAYFSFYLPEKIRLLLFGDSNDLRYFKLALAPDKEKQKLFSFEEVDRLQRLTTTLSQYSAVVIADPDRLSDGDIAALIQYIKSGGHLIFFPGERTDLRQINEKLFDVLQVPALRETRGVIGDFSSYTNWGSINLNHPVFSDIFSKKVEDINSPKFYFRILLDSKSSKGADIIKYSDNSPFLHHSNIENGSVFLFSSALDPEWSDFVHKPIFPPLLFRTVIYIASQTQQNSLTSVLGKELSCDLFEPDANYTMLRPDGVTERISPNRSGATLQAVYKNAKIPGIFELKMDNETIRQWAVNVSSQESNLEQISLDKVKEMFGEQTFELEHQMSFSEQIKRYRFGSEITKWFFLAALLFMIFEMLLAREDLLQNIPWVNRFLKEGSST